MLLEFNPLEFTAFILLAALFVGLYVTTFRLTLAKVSASAAVISSIRAFLVASLVSSVLFALLMYAAYTSTWYLLLWYVFAIGLAFVLYRYIFLTNKA